MPVFTTTHINENTIQLYPFFISDADKQLMWKLMQRWHQPQ